MNNFEPVIGLEIHIELSTKSKMFCQCSSDYFGKEPNSHVCPVCLGLPGALPVPNKKAIEYLIKIARALNCKINKTSKFDRKHYFYPDLPKGYQISQYDEPISVNGKVYIGKDKQIRITRVHMEEDTGKLIHTGNKTLIDFNRSGVPLVEIVTEPDFSNSDDVKIFLEDLQTTIRYLNVSDADMEKGSMRLEPNISIKKKNGKMADYKVEIKNINSFKFVKKAIDYEIKRQIELLKKGITPKQETRGFDEKLQKTYTQRIKEQAHDYRYFPEPDIPPMVFSKDYLNSIFSDIPELPNKRIERYIKDFKIKYTDAYILTRNKIMSDYFERALEKVIKSLTNDKKTQNIEQSIANFIINKKIPISLSLEEFTNRAIKLLSPKETDINLLNNVIKDVIKNNEKVVFDYKKGKQNAIMFLVGQVMKNIKGKAEAKVVLSELKKELG